MCPWFSIIDLILQETHKIFILIYITLKFQQLSRQWYLSVFITCISFQTLSNYEEWGRSLPNANTDQEEGTIS